MAKPLVATASFAGCFGCHMSLLDIDERILELVKLVEVAGFACGIGEWRPEKSNTGSFGLFEIDN